MPRPDSGPHHDVHVPSDILVVDDDATNLTAIEAVLAELDVEITSCRNGEEALRQLLHNDFAVILLDVMLPGLSGPETARLIRSRARSRHVPIIFITGHAPDSSSVRRGYALGAVDYLLKPIIPEVLRAKVKVFVELRNRSAEVARQGARLREIERRDAERRLEQERGRWEAEELRAEIPRERALNEHLSELDRRKDELIALLAHELRNPLVPLSMGLHVMRSRGLTDPVVIDTHARMERQVAHLTRLVDDLLDTARISEGKLELRRDRMELGRAIEQACELCEGELAARGQSLIVERSDGPVQIDGDNVRMSQVVANLLNNASKYSEPGDRIWLSWCREGERAVVRVADEGRGISASFLPRVFDTFAQEGGGHGLGLGLALVRKLVEMHGGTVEVHSEGPGQGSEFVVLLPVALGQPGVEAAPPPPAPATRREGLRVILIEDHLDVQEVMAALIESWGHRVVGCAQTGAHGIRAVLAERPDVVIIDIGLPDISGHDVAVRVRARLGEAVPRLVAVSGFGQELDLDRSAAAGFDVHLVKPPEPSDLREAIETSADDASGVSRTDGAPTIH